MKQKWFKIRNRFNGKLIFSWKCESLAVCLEIGISLNKNLSSADLSSADLGYADLRSADLRSADLRYADLRSANLSSADLRYANLDFSSGTPLHCGGLRIKKDRKQIIQDVFHTASNMKHYLSKNKDKDLEGIFNLAEKLQGEFHRINETGSL